MSRRDRSLSFVRETGLYVQELSCHHSEKTRPSESLCGHKYLWPCDKDGVSCRGYPAVQAATVNPVETLQYE